MGRLVAAALTVAGALALAAWLHGYTVREHGFEGTFEIDRQAHPAWADPLAVGLVVVAVAAAVLLLRRAPSDS